MSIRVRVEVGASVNLCAQKRSANIIRRSTCLFDNDDSRDKEGAGDQAKGASVSADIGHIGRDASLYHTSVTLELALALIESINTSGLWYTVRKATILKSQPRGLSLVSSMACLLLLHKPNSRPSLNPTSQCKISPTSKVSAVLLGACQWSLRSTPFLSFRQRL